MHRGDEAETNFHTITLGPVRSVTVVAIGQHLNYTKCYIRINKGRAVENRACLLAASRVYQLITQVMQDICLLPVNHNIHLRVYMSTLRICTYSATTIGKRAM